MLNGAALDIDIARRLAMARGAVGRRTELAGMGSISATSQAPVVVRTWQGPSADRPQFRYLMMELSRRSPQKAQHLDRIKSAGFNKRILSAACCGSLTPLAAG